MELTYKQVYQKRNEEVFEGRYDYDEKILKANLNKEAFLKSDIVYVYFISTLINSFYSTRMGNDRLFKVCNYIKDKKNIQSLKDVIDVIDGEKEYESEKKDGETFHAYSFLTKYYSIHNRYLFHNGVYSEYPILDGFVEEGVKKLIHCKYVKCKIKDLRNYKKFSDCMLELLKKLNQDAPNKDAELTLTDLDKYFWSEGKKKKQEEKNNPNVKILEKGTEYAK